MPVGVAEPEAARPLGAAFYPAPVGVVEALEGLTAPPIREQAVVGALQQREVTAVLETLGMAVAEDPAPIKTEPRAEREQNGILPMALEGEGAAAVNSATLSVPAVRVAIMAVVVEGAAARAEMVMVRAERATKASSSLRTGIIDRARVRALSQLKCAA